MLAAIALCLHGLGHEMGLREAVVRSLREGALSAACCAIALGDQSYGPSHIIDWLSGTHRLGQ